MVKQIQTVDEYYEPYDDDEDDPLAVFSAPTYFETDEQLVLIAFLMLLEQRYRLMQSMTPQEIVDEVEEIMASFQTELFETIDSKATTHIRNYFEKVLNEFSIPNTNYVAMDTSMLDLMRESLSNMVNQITGEIKVKSMFFVDNMSKDSFNLLPNFKRAVQKIVDAVGNNLIHGKEKSKRNIYKFVYGKDKLYRWLCVNDMKTCNWCLYQQTLPPRTIDELPLDHPHGRCTIDPIDYTYSDEYYVMLARGEYATAIELESEY